MIKFLMAIGFVFIISSCGGYSRSVAIWSGYDKQCIDGVSYIQFSSGGTVQYGRDGKVVLCGK